MHRVERCVLSAKKYTDRSACVMYTISRRYGGILKGKKNLPFSGFASSQTVPEPAGRAEQIQTEYDAQDTTKTLNIQRKRTKKM